MAGEERAGLAALARIETNLSHLAMQSRDHGEKLEDLRTAAHQAQLDNQAGFSEVTQAIASTDQRVAGHETEDDRRFHELTEIVKSGNGTDISESRVRQVAKGGGYVAGGGGLTLVALEVLKLFQGTPAG